MQWAITLKGHESQRVFLRGCDEAPPLGFFPSQTHPLTMRKRADKLLGRGNKTSVLPKTFKTMENKERLANGQDFFLNRKH